LRAGLWLVAGLALLVPAVASAKLAASGRYVCDDGSVAAFTEAPYGPSLRWHGREVMLAPRAVLWGFAYRGGGLELRGRGDDGAETQEISGAGATVTCNEVPVLPSPGVAAGTVVARQPLMLPEGAVVQVEVRDTARADAPAPLLGQVKLRPRAGQAPLHWWLRYDAPRAAPPARPALSVRITDLAGKLIWISDTFTPLPMTRDGFHETAIAVVPVRH
jgi:putative lipoprotein